MLGRFLAWFASLVLTLLVLVYLGLLIVREHNHRQHNEMDIFIEKVLKDDSSDIIDTIDAEDMLHVNGSRGFKDREEVNKEFADVIRRASR